MSSPWNDPQPADIPDEQLAFPEDDLPPLDTELVIPTADTVPEPAGEAIVVHRADVLAESMRALAVPVTDAQYARLAAYLEESKALQLALDGEWRGPIKAAHTLWRGLCERLSRRTVPLIEADDHVRRIGGEYLRLRAEGQERDRQAKFAAQRLAREQAAAAEAALLVEAGHTDEAAELVEAAKVAPLVEPPAPPPLKVPGLGATTEYEVTVTDAEAVPRRYCTPDLKLIKAVVKANKGQVSIAGVSVTVQQKTVRRASSREA